MRLTGPQIAAGIALAGLTQEKLALEAGVGRSTLYKIISGTAAYREETIQKICNILEIRGIEFLPGEGVRKKDRMVEIYEGNGANKKLVEDLYDTLYKTGGEILIAHLDEGDSIKNLERAWLMENIRKRKEAGITHRLLVNEDDPELIPPLGTYRSIPKEFFSPYPLYIYGNKLALVSWQPEPRVVVVSDHRFSESMRKLFDFIWMHATPIKEIKEKQK